MKTTTKKTGPAPSVVSTSTPAVVSGFTLGLDLGDRQHHVCVLDAAGQIIREASLPNTRPALQQLLSDFPHSTVALEAGTHSPWLSRFLTDLGATVLVANPRKLHAISRSERKCNRRDAQMLARLARVDPALLYPIQHGSAQAQHDLLPPCQRPGFRLIKTCANKFTLDRLLMEVAGANRRWRLQFRFRGSRRSSGVAQLFSLGHSITPTTTNTQP